MSEDQNLSAISAFVSAHDSELLGMDDYGNCQFRALVVYTSSKRRFSGLTGVRIVRNGYNQGEIGLEEQRALAAADFHLDFRPRFGTFEFDAPSQSLVIRNESQKMNGAYSVAITVM